MQKKQLHERQKKTSPKRVLAAAVALTVVFLLLASVISLAEKYIAIRKRLRDLKDEQAALVEKQETLRATNEYIETNEGRERELRAKYNVIKPGEGVVIITEPVPSKESEESQSRVGRWWESLLRGLGFKKE